MISQTIRKFTFAAAAALILAGGIQKASIGSLGWTQVAPAGASCSALMPKVPEHTATPVATALGNITMHTYAVFIGDCPFAPANVQQTLDGVRDGNARDGRVIEEKAFAFEGHAG